MSECKHESQIDIVLKICEKCSQTRNEIALRQEVDSLRESKDRFEQKVEGLEKLYKISSDRLSTLQAEQKRFREPERTMLCDILANGYLDDVVRNGYKLKEGSENEKS